MAVIENDYAAYIQTPQGEYPLRDIGAVRTDQGTENAGKVMVVGLDGNLFPGEEVSVKSDHHDFSGVFSTLICAECIRISQGPRLFCAAIIHFYFHCV